MSECIYSKEGSQVAHTEGWWCVQSGEEEQELHTGWGRRRGSKLPHCASARGDAGMPTQQRGAVGVLAHVVCSLWIHSL